MPTLFVILLYTLSFLLISRIGNGQATNRPTVRLPTYWQIKPTYSETVDYVSPNGTSVLRRSEPLNLFDYPKNTVTYVLDGQLTTDIDYVKRVMAERQTNIETIHIGKPDEHGKRMIEITFDVP